jgi:D-glycerate 3-kinase
MNREALNALDQVVTLACGRAGQRVPVVGIAGPQGSGKTTLVRAYADANLGVASFSLDDVYLTKAERRTLAGVHPLFETRGPPGTHDIALFHTTIDALQAAGADRRTSLPMFDKVTDDRIASDCWPVFEGKPNLILIDGWCLGATPQSAAELAVPISQPETEADSIQRRRMINNSLKGAYQAAFDRLDAILYLRPPSFQIIHGWRCQQEEGLLGHPLTQDDRDRITHFISHYERITRHMMAGGRRADIEVQLDAGRNVTEVRRLAG